MSQEIDFVSSEGTDEELRPKLTITYEENPIAVSQFRPVHAQVGKLKVHTTKNGIHLIGTPLASTIEVEILTPGGRSVYSGRLASGSTKIVPVTGSGIFLVTGRTENGPAQIYPALVP